jgi:enoyl-CoA hydratase/carnithine racemase
MSEPPVVLTRHDAVAVLTMCNPPLNVTTLETTRELLGLTDRLAADSAVRALVLTGWGSRAFCAGSDIREFPAVAGAVVEKKLARENEAFGRIAHFPKPTVAALNGLAYGGGLELAVCCDFIIAEEGGSVALPEIKLGVFPGSGGTIRVTRRIGEGRAKEMMFLGEPVPIETALAWGLVNRVVARGTALDTAIALARRLAELPAVALRLCKQSIAMAFDRAEADAIEATLALSGEAFATADCAEGVRAFFARQAPAFRHR